MALKTQMKVSKTASLVNLLSPVCSIVSFWGVSGFNRIHQLIFFFKELNSSFDDELLGEKCLHIDFVFNIIFYDHKIFFWVLRIPKQEIACIQKTNQFVLINLV